MKEKEPDEEFLTHSSHMVNLFDLTKCDQGLVIHKPLQGTFCEYNLKLLILLVICFCIGFAAMEVCSMRWTPSPSTYHHRDWVKPPKAWYNWKIKFLQTHKNETVVDKYIKRWGRLTLPQKRQELLRATLGEVDLYDLYDLPEPIDDPVVKSTATSKI